MEKERKMGLEKEIAIPDESAGSGRRTPPCLQWNCADLCCKYGVDVQLDEYANLIEHRLAAPEDFIGPEKDDDGILVYRTAEGSRGCIFLAPTRGCRLHNTPYKPIVCQLFPRDEAEALEAYEDGYLPCVECFVRKEKQSENPSGAILS
jgi:Fe-S-cluster containining protein